MESESGTNNTKISDSGYSNSCSNTTSQGSASSKSRHSGGSNSSRSSGYGEAPNRNESSESDHVQSPKRNKDREHKKKKQKVLAAKLPSVATIPQAFTVPTETFSEAPSALKPPMGVEPLPSPSVLEVAVPENLEAGMKNAEPLLTTVLPLVQTDIGLYAHGAILAALLKRAKTGQGQKIDCDLLSTQLSTLINIGSNYLNTGKEAVRWGTAHESIVPYQAFPSKDGFYTIGTGSDKQFVELCKLVEHEELAKNTKFLTNKDRVKNRDELVELLTKIISTKTNKEWETILSNSSFPNGPVNNLQATFNDPHVQHSGIVRTLDHPVTGKIKVVGPPVKYSEGGNEVRTPPPILGQHTDQVLAELLGYSKDKIEELRNGKIIA